MIEEKEEKKKPNYGVLIVSNIIYVVLVYIILKLSMISNEQDRGLLLIMGLSVITAINVCVSGLCFEDWDKYPGLEFGGYL